MEKRMEERMRKGCMGRMHYETPAAIECFLKCFFVKISISSLMLQSLENAH